MREADAEPENVIAEVQTDKLNQQCSETDNEGNNEEDEEYEVYEEIYEDPEDLNEESDEDSVVEIYEEYEEDAADVVDDVFEENPEKETNGESVSDPDEIIYEETDENPEEEMDEEHEEDSGEYIVVDCEEYSEEEIDEESDEEEKVVENPSLSPSRDGSADVQVLQDMGHKLNDGVDAGRGKEVVAKPISSTVSPAKLHQSNNSTEHVEHASKLGTLTFQVCKPRNMIQNEGNLKSESDVASAVSEFDSKVGLPSLITNDVCASKQCEPGESSRKHSHSRWDLRLVEETPLNEETSTRRKTRWDNNDYSQWLKPEKETPLNDKTRKRRKTRWDNHDSQNIVFQVSSSLELSGDLKVMKLKKRLMEINEMLQISGVKDKEPPEERSSPRPGDSNYDMKITGRARKNLKKSQRNIVSQIARISSRTPFEFTKKIFVPVGEYPTYKFIGLIIGPRGNTQKRMEKETGAKIRIRGKGSGAPPEDEELHVLVAADSQSKVNAAVAMVEKLLVPVADQYNEHKKAQLTELAKLRGTYKDQNTCSLCKEQGHREYACPLKDSNFSAACCDSCGSFDHPTSKCISKAKPNKEIDDSTLYVGYLPQATDEKWLKELFLPFGKIIKTAVIKNPMTGLSKGYGFVEFDDPLDAFAAVTYMNGYKMDGKFLTVKIAGQKSVPALAPIPQKSVPALAPIPSVISSQASSMFGSVPMMFPGDPISSSSGGSLCFPYSSGNVARTSLTIPPCAVTSTIYPTLEENYFSGREFSSQASSLFPKAGTSQFPGTQDTCSQFNTYLTGSQFYPYFSNPAMNEFQAFSQMTETDKKSNLGRGSRFP